MSKPTTKEKRPKIDSGIEQQLLAMAVEQAAEIFVITDPALSILYANPALEAVTGYTAAEAIGKNLITFLAANSKKNRAAEIRKVLDAGEVWNGRLSNRKKDGAQYEEVATIFPVRNEKGQITHYAAVKRDVTRLVALEAQLLQAQKLESIGQLAAGIAHEINTPIQYVGDNTRFLQDAFEDLLGLVNEYRRFVAAMNGKPGENPLLTAVNEAEELADLEYLASEIPLAVRQSLEGIERVAKIVRAMKEFSHPGTEEKTSVDLNKAIESTVTVSRNEWKYVADLELDLDAELPLVPCLPGEFNQVILNILINAAHAIGDVVSRGSGKKGRIVVRTRREGAWAEIRISDTGPGIPEAIQGKIFDPFFTTKEVGRGTGQGLAIARSAIVDKHGGTIYFETQPGTGTTFIVRLPIGAK
ncbi:MAG: PAS domain S-box protein [Myxococcales bacterium]|nr:PAS domain S-box protein [Myxococcales bacterium]